MKLKILYILTLAVAAVIWMRSGPGSHPQSEGSAFATSVKTSDAILLNDRMKLEKNLRLDVIQSENWIKINDYSMAVNELVTRKNSRDLFRITNESISDLARCLKKDFCGMEKRNDNDSYFDNSKTPGHILLGRDLEIMYESLKGNNDLRKDVDWNLVRELTDSANEKIQVMATMLLKDFSPKEESDSSRLLKTIDSYKGNAKAQSLVVFSERTSEEDHRQLLTSIEKSFSDDDPNTAMSVVEKLGKMKLTQSELEKVSGYLCHYREGGGDEHNWKMIRYEMGKLSIDLDDICS